MLTSLKSLFAAAPARLAGRADAQPVAGTADFAQLMGAANAVSVVAEGGAPAPVPTHAAADAAPTAGQGVPLATTDGQEAVGPDAPGSSLRLPPAQADSSAAGFAPMSGERSEGGEAGRAAAPQQQAALPLADTSQAVVAATADTPISRKSDQSTVVLGRDTAPDAETTADVIEAEDADDGEDDVMSAPDAPVQVPVAAMPVILPVAVPIIEPTTGPIAVPVEGAAPPEAVVARAASASDALVQAPTMPIVAPSSPDAAADIVEMPQPAVTGDDPTATAVPQRAQAQAVSLLQLVRDHMIAHRQGESVSEGSGPVATDDVTDAVGGMPPIAVGDKALGVSQGLMQAPTLASTAMTPTAAPSVDLSASLGTQVVDMGVSGQWIDGLARDIAGLSANGAQGRFQINTEQLGAIQVDIRQGSDGAAVSLTVATEAAEQALRQDGDRLKLDAALTAVRISDVKIERAMLVGETVRADASGQQSAGQQSNGQPQGASTSWQGMGQGTGSGAGQNMGQSAAQSQMQGRENFMSGHKGHGDGVVLNHDQAGEGTGDPSRARYA